MKLELKNYQKRIVEFCKTTDKVILSVGMGLGKTAAVLHYINEINPESEQDLIEYEQSLKGRERAIREVRMSIRKQRKDMYGTKLLRGRYK